MSDLAKEIVAALAKENVLAQAVLPNGVLTDRCERQALEIVQRLLRREQAQAQPAVRDTRVRDFTCPWCNHTWSGPPGATAKDYEHCPKCRESYSFAQPATQPPAAGELPSGPGFVIGDRVEAVRPFQLRCGSGGYDYAIVVSLDPLVIVSPEGDMLWRATIKPENLRNIGKAEWREYYAAIGRYACELNLPRGNWQAVAGGEVERQRADWNWICRKLELPEGTPLTAGKGKCVAGEMHVLCDHASSYERYITAYKCNDQQGEIARQHHRILELESALAAEREKCGKLERDVERLYAGHLEIVRERIKADLPYDANVLAAKTPQQIRDAVLTAMVAIPTACHSLIAATVTRWQQAEAERDAALGEVAELRTLRDLVDDFRPVHDGLGSVAKAIRDQLAALKAKGAGDAR